MLAARAADAADGRRMSDPRTGSPLSARGIVGIATAALLSEAGHTVTVIDRTGIAEETSKGNAAALAFSDIMPLASPKILLKAPKWLLDPLGPLTDPPVLPAAACTLALAILEGKPSQPRTDASVTTQTALMRLAEKEMMALVDRAGMPGRSAMTDRWNSTKAKLSSTGRAAGWKRRANAGIAFEHVRGQRLEELQPGLSPRFVAGTFVPGWKTVSEPQAFALALWAHAQRCGATFEKGRGAWSGAKWRQAPLQACRWFVQRAPTRSSFAPAPGRRVCSTITTLRIPLETERGYNTTLPKALSM
jgi:D-amino-acid dehydrogenase